MNKKHYSKKYFEDRDYLDFHISMSIERIMREKSLNKILDVGCGSGLLVKYFNDRSFKAKGCDLYSPALKMARKINKKNTIIKASANKLPFNKESYELITSISVIEHLSENEVNNFLLESYRILKPGGVIFIITPNFNSPLRFLLGKNWFGYSDPTHINFFTPAKIKNRLMKFGFKNINFRPKTAYNIPSDLHLPGFCRGLPKSFKNLLNYLMITSPLALYRDSFWVLAEKPFK